MKPTPIQWTPETVARFWDYVSQREDLARSSFTRQVGRGVASFLAHAVDLRGREVLDYGCGTGNLVGHLLELEARVQAVDVSPESIRIAEETYSGREGWRGARVGRGGEIPFDDASMEVVTCLEVIEHVLDEELDPVFDEIYRVLECGGVAMFSTPNSENRLDSTVCCPECLTEFHRKQHVRSWNAEGLASTLGAVGFEVIFCEPLHFGRFQAGGHVSWKDSSPRLLVSRLRDLRARLLDRLLPRTFPHGREMWRRITSGPRPHLAAIARKPRE